MVNDDLTKRIRREAETERRIRGLDASEIVSEIHALEDLRDEMLEALEIIEAMETFGANATARRMAATARAAIAKARGE